jgi:hypothetical protein
MKVETKLSINDKAFPIRNEQVKEFVKCAACVGTGRIKLADQKERICPECYGRLGKHIYKETKWQVYSPLTIGQVNFTITNIQSDGDFDNIGGYKEGNDEVEERYMAYETGVGSGICHKGNDLFLSEQEAIAECEKRNK